MNSREAQALIDVGLCHIELREVEKADFDAIVNTAALCFTKGTSSFQHKTLTAEKFQRLCIKGFILSDKTMNELNNWLDQMKKVGGTDVKQADAPEFLPKTLKDELREVKYNKPGTLQSLFNPANKPEKSVLEQRLEEIKAQQPQMQQTQQQQETKIELEKVETKAKPELQAQPMPPEPQQPEKSGVELALEAALKALAEDARQRKSQQEQREQQQQQQQQIDPEALEDLTHRVEVLEADAVKQDERLDKSDKVSKDLNTRLKDVENNYVGQQTFQDSNDAFEQKLAQVSKPTIVQIAGRPEVKFNKRVHCAFPEVLFLAQIFGQAYLVGPAGSGKTSVCEDVATAMGLDFGFISCSAGMAEAHLLGRMIANGTYLPSRFVQFYENGGLFLFDEVDAADANTMLVLNSALANGYLSVPNRQDNPVAKRHPDFVCLVAANTLGTGSFEYHGRNYLDAAFLDRFALSRHQVEYDLDLEREMLTGDAEMARVLHKMRFNLEQSKTRRVLSTRAFISTAKLLLAGKDPQYVIDKLLLGWTDEEKNRAKKDVVVPKVSPLKQIGLKQLEAAKTKREQEAAAKVKAELAQKEADSIQKRSKVKAEANLAEAVAA